MASARGRGSLKPMTNVLVLYASKHGHTAKIAGHVADRLRESGATVDLRPVDGDEAIGLSKYDVVAIGASIHAGHHQRAIVDWVSHHATALTEMPSALFSVSLSAAEEGDEAQEVTRKYIDDLIGDSGWVPGLKVAFAGALQYREYDFATRMMMRLLMAKDHHPTDASRDYDYTDWDAVDAFAQDVSAMAPVGAVS
jgi:menaquinone-dependent protoporphyrinogen oxidase